jgi:hypothetical protein
MAQQTAGPPEAETIERRLRVLEAELARLRWLVEPAAGMGWVERSAGSFLDDQDYLEATRLGRAHRQRQPKC